MMEPMWLQCQSAAGSARCDGGVQEATSETEPHDSSVAEEDLVVRDASCEVPPPGSRTVTPRPSPTMHQTGRDRACVPRFACGALVVGIVVCAPVHLEPVWWWRSPEVVSALAVTTDQSLAVERLYEDRLPSMRSVSEKVMGVTAAVASRLSNGEYDDELLALTGNLITLRRDQCEQRRQLLRLSTALLTPGQREKLLILIRAHKVVE